MISLRRNDKIIIIIGVIILLAAGAGVALYAPTTVQTPTPQPQQPGTGTYPVHWQEKNGTIPAIEETAAKGVPLYLNKTIGIAPIKSVSFHLSWIDNHAFFRRFGLDTLTLEVKTPDGKDIIGSMKSVRRTKAGDFTIYDNLSTSAPTITSINGSTTSQALSNLQAQFKNNPWVTKGINMSVLVTIGEHFPFRFLDKGNDFTLEVNYTYYAPAFSNTTTTGSDELPADLPQDTESSDWTPPYMSMIIQTGCGRYV
jgi:hypothetical protein